MSFIAVACSPTDCVDICEVEIRNAVTAEEC